VCLRAGVGGDQAVVGRGGAVEAGDPSSDRRAWRHDHARVGGRSAAHLSAAHGGGVEAGSVQGVDLRAARAGSAAAVAAAARAGRGGRLWGGKTIFDDYVREVRPRFLVRRTSAHAVSAGRARAVRPLGAARADPGRAWAAAPRLGGDG